MELAQGEPAPLRSPRSAGGSPRRSAAPPRSSRAARRGGCRALPSRGARLFQHPRRLLAAFFGGDDGRPDGARELFDLAAHRGDRVADPLGEHADLAGDDRKPAAAAAGRRGLQRGVERQQMGLLRDVADQFEDPEDLARAVAEGVGAGCDVGDAALDCANALDRLGDRLGTRGPFASAVITSRFWRSACSEISRRCATALPSRR